jgi:hypothetical protein
VKRDAKKLSPQSQLRALIDRFDPKGQELIRSVRAAVRKRFPTANELVYDYKSFFVIGYSPTDHGIEAIVAIAARPDGVRLYIHGSHLPDPKKLLQGSGKLARFVRMDAASQLAHPDIEALIVAAIEQAKIPLPPEGKGELVIRSDAAKRRPRRKPAK